MVTVVRVRLETGTMLPHALTSTKTVSMRMSMKAQSPVTVKQIERRSSTFSY